MSTRPTLPRLAATVLAVLLLAGSAFFVLSVVPSPVRAQTSATLHDDFTHDATLNATLWVIDGPVGSVLIPNHEAGFNPVQLTPTFSSAGMNISQVNARQEYGSIESTVSFTPPFTLTGVVEGIISNGHTFGLAVTTQNASAGALIYGNLNSTNCSNLGDCGNPNVCGNSSDPNVIPPNQCYYGIDGKVGQGGNWTKTPRLDTTPNVNVIYSLQISVDATGNAQYSVSRGGQVLGVGNAQIGTGPFYIVMYQSEGAPVESAKLNQALWMSVSLGPLVAPISTSSTSSSPGPVSTGITTTDIIIIVVVAAFLLILILLFYLRRRGFTVIVQDSQTRSPLFKATVSASGPKDSTEQKNLSEVTDKDGKAKFGEVKQGKYNVQAAATGYNTSASLDVEVKKKTDYTVLLNRILPSQQPVTGGGVHPASPSPGEAGPAMAPTLPTIPGSPPPSQPVQTQPPPETVTVPQQSAASTAMPPGPTSEDYEGVGGGRIREIIKTFQAKGAVSPETALTAEELGLSRMFVRIMKRRKGKTMIFMEINGRYYLNQKGLQETK